MKGKNMEYTEDYLIKEEDLVKIVRKRVKGSTLKKGLMLATIKLMYRNSYGDLNGSKGLDSEFGYSYPTNLTNELDIPIGNYGFVNSNTHKVFRHTEEELEYLEENGYEDVPAEEVDYSQIDFNVDDLRKEDIIKYLEYKLSLSEDRSDFTLVDWCHELDLYINYRGYKLGEDDKYYKELKNKMPIEVYKVGKSRYIKGHKDLLKDEGLSY